jgi:hypothetical protein
MSSDNQYTALGPAAIGFQTDSTDIDKGVQAQGNSIGVDGYGGPIGVRGTGGVGVVGVGSATAGGAFSSGDLVPQLHLQPQAMVEPPPSVVVTPREFRQLKSLPRHAKAGDLWLAEHEERESSGAQTQTCSLWLCVTGSAGDERAAMWRQVLLGDPVNGSAVRID